MKKLCLYDKQVALLQALLLIADEDIDLQQLALEQMQRKGYPETKLEDISYSIMRTVEMLTNPQP